MYKQKDKYGMKYSFKESIRWFKAELELPPEEDYDNRTFFVADGTGNISLEAYYGYGEDEFETPTWYYDEEVVNYDEVVGIASTKFPFEVRYWSPDTLVGITE